MHVLMIGLSTHVITDTLGDVQQRHIDYAARAGHITMIVYAPRDQGLRETRLSPHLTAIPANSLSRFTFVGDAYRLAARVHRQQPVDVVTTQDPFATGLAGLLLKWRFGLPLEVQNHSIFIDNPAFLAERARNRWFNRLAKFVIRRADTNRVLNHYEKARYVRLGLNPDRVFVLPTPVNLARFLEPVAPEAVDGLRARLGLRPEHRVAFWVGRPVPSKNLPLLFEAAARVHQQMADFRLLMAGDFSRAEHLRELAQAALGEAVVFAGRVPHEDLPPYYALCDIYVLTSDYEGIPKVLVEAAAVGRPSVCLDVPRSDDALVDGETGLIARAGDPNDLADKMLQLLQNPDLARQMGERAREQALRAFDRDKAIDALVEAWRFAAALRQRRGA